MQDNMSIKFGVWWLVAGGSWLATGLGAGGWWLVATELPATSSIILALFLVAGGSLLVAVLVAGCWWPLSHHPPAALI